MVKAVHNANMGHMGEQRSHSAGKKTRGPALPASVRSRGRESAAAAVRRRDLRRQETRDEIIAAARQIVVEQGADHLTVREIARRTHFTPSALYRYFEGGRREILLALTRLSVDVLDGYLARLRSSSSPAERIVAMGAAYVHFARDHAREEKLLFDSVTAMEPRDLAEPDESFLAPEGVFRLLESALTEGMADGTFRIAEKDVMLVILSIWAFVHGLVAVEGLRELHGGVSDERVRGLIRAYLTGLGGDWAGARPARGM
ncbi:MAG TPA: TetR/AcrR family transcriptional regulator [Thermoleophilia bacterium]|nr:TetR/AcrR family transcriptional regulator [Thermoleophilia bacterium]HQG54828.1 TetR/AcrR family transcriptional regulator [Thermoleophilia bacterium]HQJ97358.1 TetR/AcrR family transcriptional regulator [Thermoleophilia bacterium]